MAGETTPNLMDDYLLFADSYDDTLRLRNRIAELLDRLGLARNLDKGEHLGLIIDTLRESRVFVAEGGNYRLCKLFMAG
eukprot:jgi/Tetstr1/444133/TSEL_032031.t1